MKLSFIALLLSLSLPAFSLTYNYRCVNKDRDAFNITINTRTMTFLNEIEGNGSPKRGNLAFTNQGLKGGNGKMKDRYVYVWDKSKSSIYNWGDIKHYYIQRELLQGGMELRNGRDGGFITFEGQGYSYESYLCYR